MVNKVGHMILTTPTIDDVYTQILDIIQKEFNARHISLWILDEEKKEGILKAKAGSVPSYGYEVGQRISTNLGIIGWALKRGTTILADDVSKDPHYYYHPGFQTKS